MYQKDVCWGGVRVYSIRPARCAVRKPIGQPFTGRMQYAPTYFNEYD